jgi:diguanylate cyclase (GGDEF)-like protein
VVAALEELFRAAGMELTTVSDPLKFWGALEETDPDLVLLDIDMPDVTGLELCRLLRADPRWAALPVLVLTGSIDADDVHEVFAAGADDYVPKPIVGPELVARIGSRLDRARLFRRIAETDQLTGLANRTAFDAEFARLASMATRDEQPLTIALIDMDGFKQINYRHGHAFGDVVLQRLAVRLSAAFRGGDVIARWGGQEIAVAMYGMRRTDGVARVASVLEGFREESFETSRGPLHMTFAAGIAEYPLDGTDLVRLIRAAGAAVLEAKRTGGDRVLPAGWVSEDDKSATDVLLVEDDEVLASLLIQALHTRGLRSRHVADGQTALDLLIGPDRLRARVVLLDVDLPGVNGLDVLGQLSRERVVERSRVIMLTARSGESEVLTALRQGAFDHVAKPFSVPVLMQRIRRALEG